MSIVERVEQFVNGERGPYEKVTADLRALLALVRACQYLTPDDWQKVITTVGMGAESQSLHYITQALTVVTGIDYETGYTALEAVTRENYLHGDASFAEYGKAITVQRAALAAVVEGGA